MDTFCAVCFTLFLRIPQRTEVQILGIWPHKFQQNLICISDEFKQSLSNLKRSSKISINEILAQHVNCNKIYAIKYFLMSTCVFFWKIKRYYCVFQYKNIKLEQDTIVMKSNFQTWYISHYFLCCTKNVMKPWNKVKSNVW